MDLKKSPKALLKDLSKVLLDSSKALKCNFLAHLCFSKQYQVETGHGQYTIYAENARAQTLTFSVIWCSYFTVGNRIVHWEEGIQ